MAKLDTAPKSSKAYSYRSTDVLAACRKEVLLLLLLAARRPKLVVVLTAYRA